MTNKFSRRKKHTADLDVTHNKKKGIMIKILEKSKGNVFGLEAAGEISWEYVKGK